MNRFRHAMRRSREALNTRTARVGGYSFVMGAVFLAILIAVNVAVSALPSTWTHYDISASQLYSVSSSTKAVVQNLNEDVTIYWVTQEGKEDTVIEKLLDVYDALSSKLTVSKINPDIYPTFAAQYTDETVQNNSLIVECGNRSRYIDYDEIYTVELDYSSYYSTGSLAYYFDGEGRITTAIDYVTNENLPTVYVLTGHGEEELSSSFTESLERQNIETMEFSLLTVDEIPEEADTVLIYEPTSDLAEEEVTMLLSYLSDGGHVMVISGPQPEDEMSNLHELLENYGITVEEGIVVEDSRDYYAFGYPYVLVPELGESDITAELSSNRSYIVAPISLGMTVSTYASNLTITSLLDTSEGSFSKVDGYSLTTYDKEENDIDGPFSVALSVEDSLTGGELVWIGTDYIMEDLYVSYSSGANSDFVMNALSWMLGETDAISIRAKSLNYNYLTITTAQASLINVCLIGLVPLVVLALGLFDVYERRKHA